MKYLVVDDEAAICQGTVQRLRRFLPPEDAVECAFCGEDAIRQIAGSPPDVLITDIRMGAMDGLDLIEAARRVRPDIACIIITAFDSFKYAQQAIKLEVKDYLVKPYGEGDLRAAVKSSCTRGCWRAAGRSRSCSVRRDSRSPRRASGWSAGTCRWSRCRRGRADGISATSAAGTCWRRTTGTR